MLRDVGVLRRQGPATLSDVGLVAGMRNEREPWDEEEWSSSCRNDGKRAKLGSGVGNGVVSS